MRTASNSVVDSIANRICQEVRAYAGPPNGPRQRLIRQAVTVAVSDFADLVDDQSEEHAAVDATFRSIGYGLGTEGRDIDGVTAAFQVALDVIWRVLPRLASALELSGPEVADLGERLACYLRHLIEQAQRGFLAARAAACDPRGQLAFALLRPDARAGPIRQLAEAADWKVPEQVVVLVADMGGGLALSDPSGVHRHALARMDGRYLVVVSAEPDVVPVRDAVLRVSGRSPVAVTWAVRLAQAPDAYRWARRALQLRRAGQISQGGRVVDCAECRMVLLLEADPPLLEHVSVALLAPLQREGPHQRLMLAETLACWLDTRESAPALAALLSVHPQTVRNRMRRLRDLFGGALEDQHAALGLILSLRATLPRWRAEAQIRSKNSSGRR